MELMEDGRADKDSGRLGKDENSEFFGTGARCRD